MEKVENGKLSKFCNIWLYLLTINLTQDGHDIMTMVMMKKIVAYIKGTPPPKNKTKNVFFRPLPKLPPPPNSGKLYNFFGRHKRCLARITEPINYDYDNDVSDNCDHNFCTFDDFGVKNDQKVSHNMILMSKYKGQHGGKKG